MKKQFVVFVFLSFSIFSFGQTNYYVSPTGNNSNSGTSVATAWQTVQHAANSATPNSIVNILAGTYNELVSINVSGTAGNPIVFKNYQNNVVIISGSGFTSSFSNLISINSKNFITIDGLILENLSAPFANGVLVVSNVGSGVENITLKNLKIRNISYTNIPDFAIPAPGDNAHGIEIYGKGITELDVIKNILVSNCEIYNNRNGYSENLTVNGNVINFALVSNSIHDNTNIGIDVAGNFGASANPTLDHARNGLISGNLTYNNVSPVANSSGIYCDGCQDTIIENNISHHNTLGITVGCEQNGTTDFVTVNNNLVYQNTYTGIQIGGYTTTTSGIVNNATINNNTCFHNDLTNLHGELIIAKVNNCTIFNNIFNSAGTLLFYVDNINPQNYTSNYNLFFSSSLAAVIPLVNYRWNTISYPNYQNNTLKDSNSILGFPGFVSNNFSNLDFHLQANSIAINAGNPNYFPQSTINDIDEQPRANGIVDIGADEYYPNLNLQENSKEKYSLYPNPVNDYVTIRSKNYEVERIQIYNSIGQLITEAKIYNESKIYVGNFSNGTYFIKFENKSETLKFVKN
jgi:Secretion system C-terminal sorting domain/Right handed beta helix region